MLTALNMTPQDSMSMQRIAGFSATNKKVLIDDFIKTIKERGKMRQEIEVDTFKKLQKCIKKEGWSIDETFEVFDIDKNDKIDYQEMVDGFKRLKVQVPNHHLKSVFAILDEDGNGTISLKEFKNMLDFNAQPASKPVADEGEGHGDGEGESDKEGYYEQKQAEKKAKEEADKVKSKIAQNEIDEFNKKLREGKIKPETKDPIKKKQEKEIKKKLEEEHRKAREAELLNGQLKLQVAKGVGIDYVKRGGYKYFYIELKLDGTNDGEEFVSKPISFFDKHNFEWSSMIPMIKTHPDDLGDEIHIKFLASKDSLENA